MVFHYVTNLVLNFFTFVKSWWTMEERVTGINNCKDDGLDNYL